MTSRNRPRRSDFTGCRVLILCGRYEGRKGVCAGKSADVERWAISPDGSDEVLQLVFEKEFGLLVDLSANPDNN